MSTRESLQASILSFFAVPFGPHLPKASLRTRVSMLEENHEEGVWRARDSRRVRKED